MTGKVCSFTSSRLGRPTIVIFYRDGWCSSLKETDLPCTLLSDRHLEAAKAFHVAYHLDVATIAKQKQYGVNLDETTGTTLHELPVPSVFIIDTAATIRYVYSNPDYKIRLAADSLLAAAQPYRVRSGAAK